MTGKKRDVSVFLFHFYLLFIMNRQVDLILPIPIMEEIISFSALDEKMTFRVTCKHFLHFITKHFLPSFTTTLCESGNKREDEGFLHNQFNGKFGILDPSSTILFISDERNYAIQKLDLSTNQITPFCGTLGNSGWRDGIGSEAQFWRPSGLALHETEKILYVSDSYTNVIRGISLVNGAVNTIVGNPTFSGRTDGIGKEVTFNNPFGLALDSISNFLYVVDRYNHAIRKILLNEKRVETLCGNGFRGYKDGTFEEVMFDSPYDIALNLETQELYVTDTKNHVIRLISLENRTVSTLCGTPGVKGCESGPLNEANFYHPRGLTLDSYSQCLYVTDCNITIRKISLQRGGKVTPLCGIQGKRGSRNGLFPTFNCPIKIIVDPHSHAIYVMDCPNAKVRKIMDKNRLLSTDSSLKKTQKKVK